MDIKAALAEFIGTFTLVLIGAGTGALAAQSGGGLVAGATQDYAIELTPGEYVYSCPLNPTPDYRLVVTE